MKHFLLPCLLLTGISALGSTSSWMRNPAISPDGTRIAFTYKGDIYTVGSDGGAAIRITTHPSYDSFPVWTPDGQKIAFMSDRDGADNIYVVDASGGTPRRITRSSVPQTPLAFINDSTLLFSAKEMPGPGTAQAPFMPQTWQVNICRPDQRPVRFLSVPMKSACADSSSRLLYTDKKGHEDIWRKHERSSGTNDVWLYDNGDFRKLTDFEGHDMNPVWGAGDNFFYISESDGTLNVYAASLSGGKPQQLTSFTTHPVRSLSASADGSILAFYHDGAIYTLRQGGQPKALDIAITTDDYDTDHIKRFINSGADAIAVSADGSQIAFVARGDLYVTDAKYKTTRRITNTPDQERSFSFSPDGRTLVYDSDRNGYWQLFTASITNPDEKSFAYATEIEEKPLYSCATSAMQPAFSPDGKKVAFLEDRNEIRVIDVTSKSVQTVLDGKYNYSYSDGDVEFEWSPDSRHLLASYIGIGGWNNRDIALVSADGSSVTDLTESGYNEVMPKWAMGGKAITYITSRFGMKAHASWGNQNDIMLMALDGEAWDKFNFSEEEADLAEKAEAAARQSAEEEKSGKKNKKTKETDKKEQATSFDLDSRRYRTARLTDMSAFLGDYYLSPKGDKLYYMAISTEGDANLYVRHLRKGETSVLCNGLNGGFTADAKGENLFFATMSGIKKLNLDKGTPEDVAFEAIYDRRPSLERQYIFDHMTRQVADKFYDKTLHGVDWEGYAARYREFLPDISNDRDFAELMSEALGELNASHTGARAKVPYHGLENSYLGAYFDDCHEGDGLRVTDIINGGPLSTHSASISRGDIILAIDGSPIAPHADYMHLLEGKAGKKIRLKERKSDGLEKDIHIRPISYRQLNDLMYRRWVDRNEAIADSVSGGRVAYVHVRGMDGESFRTVYERLLGKYRNAEAVVVDTRYNGGGWLHNDLAILLGGREYCRFEPRGRYIGSEPFSQWFKPSAMLVNEANYSDAHGSPFAYQTLGIGDVIGAPIPGTMTAVWWETQINPAIVFGIPQVTNANLQGVPMENNQLQPDVEVYNTPGQTESGIDHQLEEAVRHMMKKADQTKAGLTGAL